LPCRVQYKEFPEQNNVIDCGIFAVAIVLHLSERLEVKRDSFSQADVINARSNLAEAFCLESAVMTSDVFKNCFPHLCDRSIMESTGAEVISRATATLPKKSAPFRYNIIKRSYPFVYDGDGATPQPAIALTSPMVLDADTNVDVENDEEGLLDPSPPRREGTTATSTISTTASMNPDTDNDTRTTDTALYRIMEEKQLEFSRI
jgi:hypothetical protein